MIKVIKSTLTRVSLKRLIHWVFFNAWLCVATKKLYITKPFVDVYANVYRNVCCIFFRYCAISFLILFFFNGCTSVAPFKEVKLVSVADIDPIAVKDNFEKRISFECQIVESVLFKYYWREFYSLGYLNLDLNKNSFSLVALDPAGVRLFQLTDNNKKVEYSTPIEVLEKLTPYVKYIAEDIRNIYFDNIPSKTSSILKKDNEIIFYDLKGCEKVEYIFGGTNENLLEKKLLKKRSWFWRLFLSEYCSVWSVNYYGYELKGEKLYPKNIFYKNNKLGYDITIRLKEIM